jgi:hypothetical protein
MYKSVLLALTLLCSINTKAQTITSEDKPAWVKNLEVVAASSEIKEGTHNTYVNLYDQQIYFLDQKIHKYIHFANQVMTPQGLEEAGKVEISFDPIYQILHVHEVSIKRGDRVINVLNSSEFEIIRKESELDQGIYNGVQTAFILIKDLQINDIVEYSYTIDGQNPIYDNKFFDVFSTQWTIPVGEFHLSLTIPRDLQLHFKYHKSTLEPKLKKSKHSKTYVWHTKNIKALDYEGDYPRWYQPRAYFEVSEFTDWNHVAQWANNVFNIEQGLNTEIRTQIANWLKSSRSDLEKIAMALKFVQENIRYMGIELGINSHQPRTPILTYETKFGDCKDKTMLLKALLHEMGIESSPALVSTSLNYGIKDRLASPILFNHVILNVDLPESSYWLDATMNNQGSSILNNSLPDYGYALLVSNNSQTLKKIKRIASQVNSKNITETFTESKVKNQFDLQIKTIYQGEFAEYWRQSIQNNNLNQLSKQFEAFYIRYYKGLKSTDTVQFQDQQRKNQLSAQENYRVKGLWSENGRYETLEIYATGISDTVDLPFRLNRSAPLYLEYPLEINQTIVINQGNEILNEDQKPVKIKTQNISYHRTYENKNGSVIIKHQYKTLHDHVKIADLETHFESLRKIRQSLSLVLVKKLAFEEKIKSSEDRLKNALRKMLEEQSQ